MFQRVGEATDVVTQGDVRLRRQGRPPHRPAARAAPRRSCGRSSSTGRPRRGRSGTPAPTSATRSPQRGRYRQFDQVGVEVLGADDPVPRRRGHRPRLASSTGRSGCARSRCCSTRSATPADRARYVDALRAYFEAAPRRAHRREPETLDHNPLRVLDSKRHRDATDRRRARRGSPSSTATDAAAHFAARAGRARRPRHPVRDRRPARPRPRLLPPHHVRVRRRHARRRRRTRSAAAAATTAWSSRSAGPPRRASASPSGSSARCWPATTRVCSPSSRRRPRRLRRRHDRRSRGAARSPPSCAPPASPPIGPTTNRSMKAQMKVADRSGAAVRRHRRQQRSRPTAPSPCAPLRDDEQVSSSSPVRR